MNLPEPPLKLAASCTRYATERLSMLGWVGAAYKSTRLLIGVLLVGLTTSQQAASAEPTPPIVFEHVAIIPMDRDRSIADQSVLVVDGRIVAIGRKVPRPANAQVIEGNGRFLLPGLADMHVHSGTGRELQVLLAHGITTVLNMGGASAEFVDQVVPPVNAGRRPGPHVYLALRVDGTPEYGQLVVQDPEQARAVVRLAKVNGYDFIKVYNNLAPDTFEAFVAEGRREGIPVVGHGVTSVGVERQLASGQLMVAHLEEFLYTAFFPAGAEVGNRAPSDSDIARVVAFTRASGGYVTADLLTYQTIARQWSRPDVVTGFLRDPEVAELEPSTRMTWRRAGYAGREGSLEQRAAFLGRFAKALSEAGVPLIAGTDTPDIPGVFPGRSLIEDLFALHSAGFSPYAALATATRTPGEMMAKVKPGEACFGVVAVGCRADLLLLKDNPLQDLRALEHPDGVMISGRWRDADALSALLAEVKQLYSDATAR